MKEKVFFLIPIIATTISYHLGGIDATINILFTLMVLDYVSGVLKAIKLKNLNSKIGLKGIIKKIGYLLGIVLAVELDLLFSTHGTLRSLVIYSLICNEGISIIENMAILEVPLPRRLKKMLEQLKEQNEEMDTKNNT